MYLEVSKKKYQRMKELLDKDGIAYTVTNGGINSSDLESYRFQLSKTNDADLARKVYTLYIQASKEVGEPVKVKKWNEKYHTAAEEAMGFITGKSSEETIEYGR